MVFRKEIGVCRDEPDRVYVQKTQDLEERDKEIKGKKATRTVSK